jgi:hypothetical protein
MSEVFLTYNVTISEEEMEIITGIVESYKEDNPGNSGCMEDAIINGILEQILEQDEAEK